MGNSGKQFLLLLWKNNKLQSRKIIVTIFEIGLPALLALILIAVRQRVDSKEVPLGKNYTQYDAGTFPASLCPTRPICTPLAWLNPKWQLFYAPNNSFVDQVMSDFQNSLSLEVFEVVGYSTEDKMVDSITNGFRTDNKSNILGGIVFTKSPQNISNINLASDVEYKIRLRYSWGGMTLNSLMDLFDEEKGKWHTRLMFPQFQTIGPRNENSSKGGPPEYYTDGFLTLQYYIDVALITTLNKTADFSQHQSNMRRFPYPPWRDDPFVLVLQQQFPLILIISFIFCALHIVKDVVHEKERRIKETLKMMGVSNWIHWAAWFVKYLLFLTISVIFMTLLFTLPISSHGSIIGYTAPTVVFVFLLVYSISIISFCFMISVFFSKANSAAAAGGVLFFVSYIPYGFISPYYTSMSWAGKMASCLISNVAMAMGSRILGMFEGTGAGVQWSTINKGVSVDDNFTMLDVMLMLLFDSLLYGMVTWYVEAVFPGEYGVPQRWYFPIQYTYWCGPNHKEDVDTDETSPLISDKPTGSTYFERDPIGLYPGIKMNKLKKVYQSSVTPAVHGTTMNMYDGQITALLGHNGAGKTTTIFMLTGFNTPTSGDAIVNDFNIRTEISSVRESLGLCPQHNVLFDTLTVQEHLWFFAKLKNVPSSEVKEEMNKYMTLLELNHKGQSASKTLSGGQKRKLSVGIALIGGSKIVILDEPTSGMDPNARRQTWDILQKHKQGRTIILTTHHMDEADVLGDRIAIMADGVVKCCGTPLFLKNKYGAGYHLVMVKQQSCDIDKVTNLVITHVTTAQLESNISAEIRYLLPYESKSQFQSLFNALEEEMNQLGIASFGVSVTTMEEVFLRVGEHGNDEEVKTQNSYTSLSPRPATGTPSINTMNGGDTVSGGNGSGDNGNMLNRKRAGVKLLFQQFCGLFLKRIIHTWRNLVVTIAQLLVPLVFTLLALIILKVQPSFENSPPLPINMSYFKDTTVVHNHSMTNFTKELGNKYVQQFVQYPGVHTHFTQGSVEDYLFDYGKTDLPDYNENYLIASVLMENNGYSNLTKQGKDITSVSYFNNQAFHTPAMSLAATMNAWFRYFTQNDFSITTVNHPLPRTLQQQINEDLIASLQGFTVSFNVLFGLSFLVSSFTLFIIRERATKAKHVQFVSGVDFIIFWVSTFCWDFINFMIPACLLLILFAAFDLDAYVGGERLGYITLLFSLYGWAVLPLMYLMSFIFTVPSSGLVWLTMFNILSGVATVLAVDILNIPQLNTTTVAHSLEWTFLTILPNFCLGQGLETLYENHEFLKMCTMPEVEALCAAKIVQNPCCKDFCGDFCLDYQENYLSWEQGGIGRMLVFLAAQGYIYFGILFIIESQILKTLWYNLKSVCCGINDVYSSHTIEEMMLQEDSDVAKERQRLLTTPEEKFTDSLVLQDLSKYYDRLLAVDRISVGIPKGECFGLLGINGAGKTSTFKMLTGDEMITSGNAYIDGFDVKTMIKKVQQRLGYCPQFDALIDQLTGRETLTLFARLRGVNEKSIPLLVSQILTDLLLEEHADKLVKAFSGGNKRKLSTAIALVGDPPIVFLDEPSTGMDPVARRQLWDTLSRIRSQGRTLVLTSHSMEECEALCTRIAIMVNGQFKCLGSPQHLKNKFGEGYTLIAKLKPLTGGVFDTQKFMDFVAATFPGSVLKDVHQGMLHYHITDITINWSDIFGVMEKAKERFDLEDYSISQTTLEQVFINFARSQIPPAETTEGCFSKLTSCCCMMCRCQCCSSKDEDRQPLIVDSDNRAQQC